MQVDLMILDAITRYYLGLIIIYYFLAFYRPSIDLDHLICVFFVLVLCEAILINTIINPFQYLPNYPKNVFENDITIGHVTKFMGFYQRPYSIGMNASCSSSIMCGLLLNRALMINKNQIVENWFIEFIGFLTILMFASGVGLTLYFFYYLYKKQLFTRKRVFYFIVIAALLYNFYIPFIDFFDSDSILQKVSTGYMNFLIELKIVQFIDVLELLYIEPNSIWIGQFFSTKSDVIIQSDFAWCNFFQCAGLIGVGIYIVFVIKKSCIFNYVPITILLFSALHYGGIFTLPGQIVLANILLCIPSYTRGN